ncbi:unnamed protein product [Colias eurytheme]|nr:unnamed protein product [Colias eurytheme]
MDKFTWGCCQPENENEPFDDFILCLKCKKKYHNACISLDKTSLTLETRANWYCPECVRSEPKTMKNDNTPIRNVSTTRGSKRQALNSPPMHTNQMPITRDDIREVVQEVFQDTLNNFLSKIHEDFLKTLNKELKPIREELSVFSDSMTFINSEFEDIKKEHEVSKTKVIFLEKENENLKSALNDLLSRSNQIEQYIRQNNCEIQCVPEHKNENLMQIIMDLSKRVGYELNEKDVLNCTRTAKKDRTNTRPRSIVIQFVSPRLRDHLLAAVATHNKKHPQNKLNSSDLNIPGKPTPIYISEHLSPANKILHAATRIKAKNLGYRFVWVRNGRIFLRKNEESGYILVTSKQVLDKLE